MLTKQQKNKLDEAVSRPVSMMFTGAAGDLFPAAVYVAGRLLETDPDSLKKHPDFYLLSTEDKKMGVEEAMQVIQRARLKAVYAEKPVLIIDGFDKFSVAAQNKLLLTIEDGNAVFLITAYTNRTLDTVKSRLRKVTLPKSTIKDFQDLYGEDGELLYVLAQGCLAAVEKRTGDLDLMKELARLIEGKQFLEVFKLLHLVKEKDPENFFEKRGMEGTGVLYQFLSYVFSKWLVYLQTGRQECGFCQYREENIHTVIQYAQHINEHAAKLYAIQYTKEHFFQLFAEALFLYDEKEEVL